MEAQTPRGVKWTLGVCGEQPQRLGSLQGAAGRVAALLGAGMEGLGVPSPWGAPRGPAAGTARDGDASSRCSKLGHICCLCMGLVGLLMKSGGGLWAEDGSESSEGGVLQLGHLGALGQQRSGNWDCRDLGIGIAEIWGHWDSGNLLPLLLGGSGGGQDTQCLAGEGVGMSHGWSRGEVGAKSTSPGPHPSRGHTSLLLLLLTS